MVIWNTFLSRFKISIKKLLLVKSQLTVTCSQNPKIVLTNWKLHNPTDSNSKWRQPHYVRKGVTNASRVNEVTLLLLLCTTVFLIKSKNSFFFHFFLETSHKLNFFFPKASLFTPIITDCKKRNGRFKLMKIVSNLCPDTMPLLCFLVILMPVPKYFQNNSKHCCTSSFTNIFSSLYFR